MAAGKMMSMPNRFGSGISPPSTDPAKVAMFQGMKVATMAATQ